MVTPTADHIKEYRYEALGPCGVVPTSLPSGVGSTGGARAHPTQKVSRIQQRLVAAGGNHNLSEDYLV
jgi:hypothetical protein